MTDEIYRKKPDGSLEPVGFEFKGFPANGIWLVADGTRNCIVKMEDISNYPFDVSVWMGVDEERIMDRLNDRGIRSGTVRGIVREVIRTVHEETLKTLE